MTKFKIETYGIDDILVITELNHPFLSEDESCIELRITNEDIIKLREYLMKDVVGELEVIGERNDRKGCVENPNFNDGVAFGCEKAIIFIKNGVKNE